MHTPEKAIKNEESTTFILSETEVKLNAKMPFVISSIPHKNADIKAGDIEIIFDIPKHIYGKIVECSIEITTEANTMYPPTIRIDTMLSYIISFNETGVIFGGVLLELFDNLACFFVNIIPFKKLPIICDINKIYPTFALWKIPIPTLPIINIGPEVEQKLSILVAVCLSILFEE